jgi:serine/threonine-protein kinase RsbT
MIVRGHEEFEVWSKNDLALVRRHIRCLAEGMGMSQMKEVQMRTAATELLTNMLRYAGGGRATIEEIEHESMRGVRAQFQDEGPGIPDIDAALTRGFSTGKSLGQGLSGCRNLVDIFDLNSKPGKGTRVVITKWC